MKLDGPVPATRDASEVDRPGSDEAIRVLVPDLPVVDDYVATLRRIDAARWYTNGGAVNASFEAALADLLAPQSTAPQACVTTSSGTTALETALACLDLAPGARVLVPAYTFPATANAVVRAGHVPVLSDVCPQRWTLTPQIARAAVARGIVDAVVPVAVFGTRLPIDEWDAFVETTRVPVVIDAAAALGVLGGGKRVTLVYSLHATKPLGIGEGGVIAAADAASIAHARRLINHGFQSNEVVSVGANARLSEYGAAVGLAQLARWPALLERRRALWRQMRTALSRVAGVTLQHDAGDAPPAVLTVETGVAARSLAEALRHEDIETRCWYSPPLHAHRAFASMPRDSLDGRLPVAERLGRFAIGLPFHTRLTVPDVDRVAVVLASALQIPVEGIAHDVPSPTR